MPEHLVTGKVLLDIEDLWLDTGIAKHACISRNEAGECFGAAEEKAALLLEGEGGHTGSIARVGFDARIAKQQGSFSGSRLVGAVSSSDGSFSH